MIITTLGGAVVGTVSRPNRTSARGPRCILLLALSFAIASCESSVSDITAIDEFDLGDATIEAVSGDGQEAEVGSNVAEPLVVVVKDPDGNPVSDVPLEWTFTQGQGRSANSNSSSTATILTETDEAGISSVEWQLGTGAGRQEVSVGIVIPGSTPPSVSGTGAPRWEKWFKFWARAWPGAPRDIAISPDDLAVEVGASAQLEAVVSDRHGNPITDAEVTWASSDVDVAAVNVAGLVEARGDGTATVTASAGSAEGTATIEVTSSGSEVTAPGRVGDLRVGSSDETSITVRWTQVGDGAGAPANYALRIATPEMSWGAAGPTQTIVTGTSVGDDLQHTWTGLQSDTGYELQLVSYRGTIGGEAVFGELSNVAEGSTWPAEVVIADVVVSPTALTLQAGDTTRLQASALDESGEAIEDATFTWSTSNSAVVTVDAGGLVTAVSAGTASVVASVGEVQTSVDVAVEGSPGSETNPGAVGDVEIVSSTENAITVQWTQVADGGGAAADYALRIGTPAISWGSADATQIVVSGTSVGQAIQYEWSGLEPGTPYEVQLVAFRGVLGEDAIFGELSNVASGETDAAEVVIESVVVTAPRTSISVGEALTLEATALDASGAEVGGVSFDWSSSNASVLTVVNGVVTAVSPGTGTITASVGEVSGSISVTVETVPVPLPGRVTDLRVVSTTQTSITLRWTQVDDGTGAPADYALRLGSPSIDWESAGATEVTVEGTGVGLSMEYTWENLDPGVAYAFQVVAYRMDEASGSALGDRMAASDWPVDHGSSGRPASASVMDSLRDEWDPAGPGRERGHADAYAERTGYRLG